MWIWLVSEIRLGKGWIRHLNPLFVEHGGGPEEYWCLYDPATRRYYYHRDIVGLPADDNVRLVFDDVLDEMSKDAFCCSQALEVMRVRCLADEALAKLELAAWNCATPDVDTVLDYETYIWHLAKLAELDAEFADIVDPIRHSGLSDDKLERMGLARLLKPSLSEIIEAGARRRPR